MADAPWFLGLYMKRLPDPNWVGVMWFAIAVALTLFFRRVFGDARQAVPAPLMPPNSPPFQQADAGQEEAFFTVNRKKGYRSAVLRPSNHIVAI